MVWLIERLARVNAVLTPLGGGRGLCIHPFVRLSVGSVVTVASPRERGGVGLFVVVRDDGERASIARLAGDANPSWPKTPALPDSGRLRPVAG